MTGRQAIEELLSSVEKPRRHNRPSYRKPQAIKDFEVEHKAWFYSGRTTPPHIQSITKFRDDSADELTKLIIAFLRVQGAFATRLNSTGVYRNDLKKFVPNTQRRGMADIVGTYQGKSLNIEVKIGRDRMSEHQLKVKKEIEAAGGYYYVAKDFEGFVRWFKQLNFI